MYILTFDIEDWFHILDHTSTKDEQQWNHYECRIHESVEKLLTLLEKTNNKATFFCLGWVARRYPEVIRMIDRMGFEIGSHSFSHQLAFRQSPSEFRSDLIQSIDTIGFITGKRVRAYRAPGFSITEKNSWVFEILAEEGITIDCSIFPAQRGHGGYVSFGTDKPSIVMTSKGYVKEFPLNTTSILGKKTIFSGGGYFRLLPYVFVKYMLERSSYVMCYFHPRDFDAEQPVLWDLPPHRIFKSYYGIPGAWKKLVRMLSSFRFNDIEEAEKKVSFSTAPQILINKSYREFSLS